MLNKLLNSKEGSIIISVLLGLGLASVFRNVCKNGKCIIYNSVPIEETNKFFYKMEDSCFKYKPVLVPCNKQ